MCGAHEAEHVTLFECHQALHGYGDGHELLASSTTLPRPIRSTMLLLSDLSGPSVLEGFTEYWTGYPLTSERLYAVSRTWYAPEMPRPGCVWTHTLLLPFDAFGRVPDLSVVKRAVARPTEEDRRTAFRRYAVALRIEVEATAQATVIDQSEAEPAGRLLQALYGSPSCRVIVAASSESQLAGLVFAVWSQQWPSLRQTFSFCTGSLGLRSAADFPFDLQIVPQSVSRQFANSDGSVLVQLASSEQYPETLEDWTELATGDLRSSALTPLRQFLWVFGSEQWQGRDAFGRLCHIYALLSKAERDERDVRRVVEDMAARYPEPDSVLQLKAALFSYPDGALGGSERPQSEQIAVAKALLSAANAFGSEVVQARKRGSRLAQLCAAEAIGVAGELLAVGVAGEEFVGGMAQALRPEDVFTAEANDPVIVQLVRANPTLATSPLAWTLPEAHGRAVVQGLKESPYVSPELMVSIMKTSLDSGVDSLATQELDAGIDLKVSALLGWLSETHRGDAGVLLSRWKFVLIEHDDLILQWITSHSDASPIAFLAAALVLNPSINASELGGAFWSKSSLFPFLALDRSDRLRAASFVLRKALETSDPAAASGVAAAFALAYEAAEHSQLPEEAWWIVSDVLPGSWWTWDRCQRLIEGVVNQFARWQWPVQEFVRSFGRVELLDRALDVAKWNWRGTKYHDEVCRAFAQGRIEVSEGQARALRSLCPGGIAGQPPARASPGT